MVRFLLLFTSLILVALFSAYDLSDHANPVEKIGVKYKSDMQENITQLKVFKGLLASGAKTNEIWKQYRIVRTSFKRYDYYLIYFNRYEVETFINGAPLPKLAIDTDNPNVLEPKGYQVIDECMAEIDVKEVQSECLRQVEMLIKRLEVIQGYQSSIGMNNRQAIEAMRMGITSMATLGISGFDTPGSFLGLEDVKSGLQSMQWSYEQFEHALSKTEYKHYQNTVDLFKEAEHYLNENSDFNEFDRFTFTRDFLNPLNTELLRSQEAMYIEFRDEVEDLPLAVNFRSEHLFSEDYLNVNHFVQTGGKKHNEELETLGKTLFFDPILSSNNERSCASCHNPEKGFSEDLAKSLSFDGESELPRNAMTLTNASYSEHYFYDFRAGNLSTQFEHVFVNEGEFNTTYPEVVEKLNNCSEYVEQFRQIFGEKGKAITREKLNIAIATYVSTLNTHNSDFDQMIRAEKEEDKAVVQGYNIFMGKGKCGTCHFPPTFAGLRPPYFDESESEVIGVTKTEDLDNPELDEDHGRMHSGGRIDEYPMFDHSFKTVTLRNTQLSAPYFHNGAFSSLEKVMEFYNKGGGAGLGVDLPNQTLPFDSLSLTEHEITQVITFLHALTDIEGLTDVPTSLPECHQNDLSARVVGGNY